MNIPEEFGNYLLLKKLREDALGETFRAGRVGRDAIDQVVLLRVFNGQGMDGEKLWQRVSGRAVVQQALRSPNIGSGVDLGKVRSFPYVAYDYISGKNLATMFAQAARQHQPIPVDHALLICERLALALAAAYETRVQDERVLHGFVLPHLVMISNEGETRLLGFEAAPGLRDLWAGGWRNDDVAAYVAPEAAAGLPTAKSDDVYSLGAILFELLCSERLPAAAPAEGYGPMIDAMVLPNEGIPLPAGIANLLKKSLAPRDQRVPDALTWHKTIAKLIIEEQFTSTTFNLAFFMHNLFRDEIDRESQEIEAEKKLELPRRQAAGGPGFPATGLAAGSAGGAGAAGAAAAGAAGAGAAAGGAAAGMADMRERTGVRDAAWAAGSAGNAAAGRGAAGSPGGSRTPLWIGIAAAALAVLALGGWLLFGRGGTAAKPVPPPVAPAAAGTPGAPGAAGATSAEDANRKAAELQAQIQQMIEARSKDMESKLKTQYDDQIKQLQGKLDDSRRAAAEQEREKARGERIASSAPLEMPVVQAPSRAAAERAEQGTSSAAGAVSPSSRSAAASGAGQPPLAGGARETAAAAVAAPAVAPPPAAAQVAESSAKAQPQIQTGDLVQGGPGITPPRALARPAARYPVAARRMNRSAEVLVKVLVDERGRVVQAERQGSAVGLGFDEEALEVARRSSYQPATTRDGVRVKMWTTMKITFVPGAM